MLVLTRKKGETIFIGEDIRIVLVSIQEKQVRIGIACPDALPVMRGELGKRTKKGKWPNLTPDEIVYLVQRKHELSEWWTLPNAQDRKHERNNLESFIEELQRWTFIGFLERYSQWYKATEHGGKK